MLAPKATGIKASDMNGKLLMKRFTNKNHKKKKGYESLKF